MSWSKLDNGFFGHPKAELIDDPIPLLLYLAALAWSGQQSTDGAIPTHALRRGIAFAARVTPNHAVEAAAELVKAGLWETTPDGWQIHNYAAWQITTEDREREREMRRERQRKWRDGVASRRATEPADGATRNETSRPATPTGGGVESHETASTVLDGAVLHDGVATASRDVAAQTATSSATSRDGRRVEEIREEKRRVDNSSSSSSTSSSSSDPDDVPVFDPEEEEEEDRGADHQPQPAATVSPELRARAEALARAAHERAVAEGRVTLPARHLAACLASAVADYGPILSNGQTTPTSGDPRGAPLAFCANHGPDMLPLLDLSPAERWAHHDRCTTTNPATE